MIIINILYISNLPGCLFAGPTYSIPNQINAQSRYDNVFWYNISSTDENIYSIYEFYHDILEYPRLKISALPSPFDTPDLTIIEEVYPYHNPKIILELWYKKLPYVIVPRSQLTLKAQQRRAIKKKLCNLLFFNRMIKQAIAIQYLTQQEMNESIKRWKQECFIVPNGINVAEFPVSRFHKERINAVYIGRLEPYQKGLDLLIKACDILQAELREKKFTLSLYGTWIYSKDIDQIKEWILDYGIKDIVCLKNAVFREEKRNVLMNADLFIMTSRFEGQPMGLLEALSYGLPCIVTYGTNMREEIEAFGAGWTAEGNTNSIVDAMRMMLSESSQLEEKGQHAFALSQKYDWSRLAEQTHEIYSDLVEKGSLS